MRDPQRKKWRGRVAIVTGASSGIGEATALRLAREGMRVVLVARRGERLAEVAGTIRHAGGQALAIPADLTQASDRAVVLKTVGRDLGPIDVLINNAGFGWYGFTHTMPAALAQEMIALNATAAVDLTLGVLPAMVARRTGHVINVSSVAGSLPSQGVAVYGATKSFLDTFSRALARELRGSGVHVSVVKPGPVISDFYRTAAARPSGHRVPAEGWAVRASQVVDRIWHVLNRPRRIAYVPRWLCLTPWVELSFGWLIDRLGPVLLRERHGHPWPAAEPSGPPADGD